jgi:hypothetical protein
VDLWGSASSVTYASRQLGIHRSGGTYNMLNPQGTGHARCPDHPEWHEFLDRLGGTEGCNFRLKEPDDDASWTWTCDGTAACPLTKHILSEMGLTVDVTSEGAADSVTARSCSMLRSGDISSGR